MTLRDQVNELLDKLPDLRVAEVLDFVRYLYWLEQRGKEELESWQRFGLQQFAKCYGPEEPEYTLDDLKPERQP
jgi:hypothetical protein